MGLLDRFKPRPPAEEANPWETSTGVAETPMGVNPWKKTSIIPTVKVESTPWRTPSKIGKNWVLHKASLLLIVVNIGVGLFFYSNNTMFNAALLGYLGASTILLAHYWGLTRGG